jgi:mannose-6-phosphate isomerase-like protein (cupin superfamily)
MADDGIMPVKEEAEDHVSDRARKIQTFHYEKPDVTTEKGTSKLCQSDILKAAVQIVRPGGGNNLHSHAVTDTCWLVLKGRARFYGEGDSILGEFGPMEGIMTPRGTQYWFESAIEGEDLEMLQAAAKLRGEKDVRTNHAERPARQKKGIQRFSARTDR